MRNTRRALTRGLLFVAGLILIVVGVTTILGVSLPVAAALWSQTADDVRSWADGIGQPSLGIGAVAALVVLAALLVLIAVGAVRGRHRVPLRATSAENEVGRLVVTDGFAAAALKNSLDGRDEILSSRVAAGEVRREPVLHVSVTPRQNTSPRQVAEYVDTLVSNLSTLTGQRFRTYVSVHSGLRARLAGDQKRLN